MDLTPENVPPGTQLKIGTAIIEITDTPHNGCDSFVARYGRDACIFVNTRDGKRLRLRGIYGRVIRDGHLAIGDTAGIFTATALARISGEDLSRSRSQQLKPGGRSMTT